MTPVARVVSVGRGSCQRLVAMGGLLSAPDYLAASGVVDRRACAAVGRIGRPAVRARTPLRA
jgi:hypothetical protein